MASLRRCKKLPPQPIESVSAGSKMDLPQAKAEHISDGGSTSGITKLRKGKKVAGQLQRTEDRSENT